MPGGQEDQADYDQGAGQADPDAGDTPVVSEAEDPGDWHAQEPVAGEVGQGGGARVAKSAQGAGGNYLEAVEDFEKGGNAQECGAGGDDGGLGRVEARDPTGDEG